MDEKMLLLEVPAGAVFEHYRNKKRYKILSVGRHTEEMQLYVVYQGLYDCESFGPSPVWVRPLKMFLESIEGSAVRRFLRVE
jgi:hypothetical protein